MFDNFRISHRLTVMAGFSAILFVISIVIGMVGLQHARDALKTVYEDRTIPLQQLGEIKSLMLQNYGEVLLGFQHDPNSPAHLLHQHTLSQHTEVVLANKAKIDEIWAAYLKTYLVEEEKKLIPEFVSKRKQWMEILLSTLDSLAQNNFQVETLDRFERAANEERVAASKTLDSLLLIQVEVAKQEAAAAEHEHNVSMTLYVCLFIVWLAGFLWLYLQTLRHINSSLNAAGDAVSAIAAGNFSKPMPRVNKDEIGELVYKIAQMRESLQTLISSVREEIKNLNRASGDLIQTARSSAQISENQSQAASTMAAAIEQLSASITEVQNHAINAGDITQTSANQSQESSRIIDNATRELGEIAIAVNATATTIQELEVLSEQITSIANVIKSIADQTNLLALNAAIEAARAGEQGRGFSVVADEVRTLAGRTSSSTQEISSMIQRIQNGTERAVKEMNSSVGRVNDGVNLANSAGHSVADIRNSSQKVALVVNDISNALREQTIATQEISKRVEQVADGAEQNNNSVSKTAAAAQRIEAIAHQLETLTQRFNID